MAKSKNQQNEQDEDAIMERMNEALKRMRDTPPETHKEMVERRHSGSTSKRKPSAKG
jgi:hypothetical protein